MVLALDWRKFLYNVKLLIYNKETKEILGKKPLGWVQLLTFYSVFYLAIGAFFAVHIAIFVGVTPSPAEGITPWNFGRYAYPNYPNAKIGMVAIPGIIDSNRTYSIYRNVYREKLISLASVSDVDCINVTDNYKFVDDKACILLHITKVFEWTPESLAPFLAAGTEIDSFLNISCFVEDQYSNLGISMSISSGIPLSIPNNPSGRSFPFQNQLNYTIPLVGVALNLTDVHLEDNFAGFDVRVTCGIDRAVLGIENWSQDEVDRVYELPDNTSFIIHFTNTQL